jgi:hypothetical protein
MGAGRMLMTWFAGFLLLSDPGYRPRHRSKRRAGAGRLTQRIREDASCARISRPAGRGEPATASWLASPPAVADFPGQLACGQIRRMLLDCAVDDLTRIIPEIVQVVAHSSAGTMTAVWNDFRQAAENGRALGLDGHDCPFLDRPAPGPYPEKDAVVIKIGQANDALWLIANGFPYPGDSWP